MPITIYQLLLNGNDDLEDDVLYSLSDLNMLQNFTPEELGMTKEEVEADSKKTADLIAATAAGKDKIEQWLTIINDTNEEEYKEAVFKDLPWIKEKYKRLNNEE